MRTIEGKYNVVRIYKGNGEIRSIIATFDTYEQAIAYMKTRKSLSTIDLVGPSGRFCSWVIK